MTKTEALEKLKGKTGRDKWLVQEQTGEFVILNSQIDPWWRTKAINLFSNDQIEAAAEWIAEASLTTSNQRQEA